MRSSEVQHLSATAAGVLALLSQSHPLAAQKLASTEPSHVPNVRGFTVMLLISVFCKAFNTFHTFHAWNSLDLLLKCSKIWGIW